MMRCKSRTGIFLGGLIALAMLVPALAAAQDWDQAAEAEFVLFLPGQTSWEWLLIPTDHGSGPARRMREGRPCLACHQGEEATIGNVIASGERLEPHPVSGMPGSIKLKVKGVVADDHLHLRLSWPAVTVNGRGGESRHAAMVTTLVADDAVSTAHAANCWAACHSDLPGMSDDAGKDLTKYLSSSRERMTRTGGGDSIKSADELAAEIDKGAFLEYWSALLDDDGQATARDGYFLEARVINDDVAVETTARQENGHWVVELSRPLAPEVGPRKTLEVGTTYPISFAVHEAHTKGRRHYVSFPLAVTIGETSIEITEVEE
jgi:hypothetical protein